MMSFESAVFWNCVEATARWRAGLEEFRPAFRDVDLEVLPASADREDPTSVASAAEAAVDEAGRSCVDHMVATCADRFCRRPILLEAIAPGLSLAAPKAILATCDILEERYWRHQPARVGFGGEVTLINIKAARLYAQREIETDLMEAAHG